MCRGSSSSRRKKRKGATKEFAQLRTKQIASDHVDVEVVGEYNMQRSKRDKCAALYYRIAGTTLINPPREYVKRCPCAAECDVDERSGDQRDGRHGGIGRG